MALTLVPVTAQGFPRWIERSRAEYEADLVLAGDSPDTAAQRAGEALRRAFPEDQPNAGNAVFELNSDGTGVGYLWIGPDTSGDPTAWWVWDIVVDPEHRGRGFGRSAMLLAEDHARAEGARTLGLSVFGFNAAARGLYESVGYDTTSVKMRKRL